LKPARLPLDDIRSIAKHLIEIGHVADPSTPFLIVSPGTSGPTADLQRFRRDDSLVLR